MMHSQPWFRDHDGWWYFYFRDGGKRRQVKLAKGKSSKKEAFERWHHLCRNAKECQPAKGDSAVTLLDEYLDWCQRNRSKGTYEIYRHHIETFCRHVGTEVRWDELKPKHVTTWLDSSSWSDSTKAGAAQTIRTAFLWLLREGHIDRNPVAGARGPAKVPRETILSDEQFALILKHSRPDFRLLLEFIRHTGCRPQEAVRIERRHVELPLRRIVFFASEAKGKKHPRVIYLDDRAFEIVAQLCQRTDQGILFRNAKGDAWNRNKVRCRFRRLRAKVGGSFCAYHLRHTFATSALQKLDPISVASLMGHSDASTLARNYQHLAKLPDYMLEAAKKATS